MDPVGSCASLGSRIATATHPPEQNEILQHGKGNVDTVQKAVKQEKDEELVIGKVDAVVNPRTMVI